MNNRIVLAAIMSLAFIIPCASYAATPQALVVRYAKPLFVENILDKVQVIQGTNCPGNTSSWIFSNSMQIAVSPWPKNISQTYSGLLNIVWQYASDNNNQVGTSCTSPIPVDFATLKQSDNMWAADNSVSKTPRIEYVANGNPLTQFSYTADLNSWKTVRNKTTRDTYYFIGCENDTSDSKNRFIRCCFNTDSTVKTCG